MKFVGKKELTLDDFKSNEKINKGMKQKQQIMESQEKLIVDAYKQHVAVNRIAKVLTENFQDEFEEVERNLHNKETGVTERIMRKPVITGPNIKSFLEEKGVWKKNRRRTNRKNKTKKEEQKGK